MSSRATGRRLRSCLLALAALLVGPAAASATWSVVAVDLRTGRVVIASATCVSQAALVNFPARGLMDIQAIVVPGVGVAAAQAGVDRSRENQTLIYEQLKDGTHPRLIVEMLRADPDFQRRQFGIVDLQGRTAGFNGERNNPASLYVAGNVGDDIYFQVQGNILFSDSVAENAALRFTQAHGTLADRVMAAMEGADEVGGDKRCTCEEEPKPAAPCDGKTSHVAYIAIADKGDKLGTSHNDGDYYAYISVTDEDIQPHENANPVITLRMRYEQWKNEGSKRTGMPPSIKPAGMP